MSAQLIEGAGRSAARRSCRATPGYSAAVRCDWAAVEVIYRQRNQPDPLDGRPPVAMRAVGRMTRSAADMPLAPLVTGPVTPEGAALRTATGAAPDRGLPEPSPAGQSRVLDLDQPATQRSGICR